LGGGGVENRVLSVILYGPDREEKMEIEENCEMKVSKVALHEILLV
jgi:hypothetical protein